MDKSFSKKQLLDLSTGSQPTRSVSASPNVNKKTNLLRKRANTKLNLLKSTFSKKQLLDLSTSSSSSDQPACSVSASPNVNNKTNLLRKRANTKLNLLKSTFSRKQLLDGTNNFDVSIRDISMLGTSVLEEEETPRRGSGVGREEAGVKRRKPRRLRLKSIKILFGDKSKKKRSNLSEAQTEVKKGSVELAHAVSGSQGGAAGGKTEPNADEEHEVDGEEMIKLKNNAGDHYVKVAGRERIQNFSNLHW